MSNQNKQLYIVISQTGTILSRILKQITGAEYNHASISLSRDLERMYSFGRRHPYNPFWGGFVIESPRTGTFKRFSETKVLVLSVSVTEEQHAELKEIGGPQEQAGGKRCASHHVRSDDNRPFLCRDQRILLWETGVGLLHL